VQQHRPSSHHEIHPRQDAAANHLAAAKGPVHDDKNDIRDQVEARSRRGIRSSVGRAFSFVKASRLGRKVKGATRVLSLAAVMYMGNLLLLMPPAPARASAPVMALPKAEGRDPASEAIMEHDRRMQRQAQAELTEMARQAREIEATEGEKARVKFEKEYKINQQKRADEKAAGLLELQRNLLDQGIDPWCDLEGQRQVTFYEKGVDLGDVAGTPYNLEKEFEKSNYKRSMAFQKAYHRQVIACMVQDLKNRGLDPLEYFRTHPTKTENILNLSAVQAKALAEEYSANLEQYGQVIPPKEGEMSALERMREHSNDPEVKKAAKVAAKQAAAQAKAEARAQAQELKEREKAATESAKEAAKRQADIAKAQAMDATRAALERAAAELPDVSLDGEVDGEYDEEPAVPPSPVAKSARSAVSKSESTIPIVPVSAFLVAAGGGGFALKLYKDKAARDEEERQRQFRLLMGIDKADDGSSKGKKRSQSSALLDETDTDLSDLDAQDSVAPAPSKPSPVAETAPPSPAPAPKKKKLSLGVFSRKKNGRETELNALVQYGAKAPDFAKLLAKILTFGAPGRFPNVVALPGKMPLEDFDLDVAKQMLVDARRAAVLELEESAEVFADVVNCMLIDIVDLASSSLKEDDKTTIEAIDIVVDFMQHAASLYDAVAGDVGIAPVTYGGTMSKSKLEQMYSVYAGSAMLNIGKAHDDFDSRVRLLQDVFQITDKKAEGLMLKVMQKNMLEMMKSGEGLEGMQEMLGGMGGMEGMMPNGMPGLDGAEPSPEEVKEMLLALKQMKDSGSFSKEDLEKIKKDFKASFGSSIDDLSKGQPLDDTEKELLELMKSILDD
jgi:hypothetical protein